MNRDVPRRSAGRITGDARGVTLAEVATTLALLGAMSAVTAPALPRLLAAYQLRGAAQMVFSELQRARMAAVMENNRFRFTVVDGSPRFAVHDDENGDDVENDGDGSVVVRSVHVDSPGVVLKADGVVSFAPNGTARAARRIYVTSPFGDTAVVAVSTGGRICIE